MAGEFIKSLVIGLLDLVSKYVMFIYIWILDE